MSASESLVDQPKKNILNIETGAVKFVKVNYFLFKSLNILICRILKV